MPRDAGPDNGVSRRQFFRAAITGAVIAASPQSANWLASSRPHGGVTKLTPRAALEELLAGNQRFVANRLTSCGENLSILKERTAEKQEPFAAVLACADSRVPVELVFDQTIGQLFVTRVAGNIVTSEIIASLEYGVAVLGVRALLVLGHTNCGAVKAAMETETVPGQISALYPHLRPAVERSAGNTSLAIDVNARMQRDLLSTSSTIIRDATQKGILGVAAGVYDLRTGKVTLS